MVTILNGYDLKTTFNCVFENAVNVMWGFAQRKASLKNSFANKNGDDIDLVNPKMEARNFIFNCVVSGKDMAELKNNYFALYPILKGGNVYSLYNDVADMTMSIYYQKQSGLTSPYRNSENGYSVRFQLEFDETDPDLNIPNIYLVDDQNRFLVP
jgi:hypothetical protein